MKNTALYVVFFIFLQLCHFRFYYNIKGSSFTDSFGKPSNNTSGGIAMRKKWECKQCHRYSDILRVMEKMDRNVEGDDDIQEQIQGMIEELCAIMDLERCVVFRLYKENDAYWSEEFARNPKCECEGELKRIPLSEKPDVLRVFEMRDILHIVNPHDNPLTVHFHEIVERKSINEILYLPLTIGSSTKKVRGVIVLDAVGNIVFGQEEKDFCAFIGELISRKLHQEEIRDEQENDRIRNRTMGLGGFTRRILRNAKKILEEAEIIAGEVQKLEGLVDQNNKRRL